MKHFTLATALALAALLVSSAFVSAQKYRQGNTVSGGYGSAREAWMDRASRNGGGGY